ncbi:MAG: DUF2497 domain-containing protein [Pseudomonadota bacterium]
MGDPAAKEPTMEEILASIRRIISEDGEPVGEASGGDSPAVSVASDEGIDSVQSPEVDADDAEHLLSVEELLGDDLEFEEVEIGGADEPEISPDLNADADQDIMEDVFDMEDAVAAEEPQVQQSPAPSMEANVSKPQPVTAASTMEGPAANALESFVRAMIEPMINEWLESNLEGIVNAKVDAELQRVATRVRQALVDEK